MGSWRCFAKKANIEKEAQIDLLFDRSDGVISICEIKYSEKPFLIDKDYAENLLNEAETYRKYTKIKK
ncbi:MAG: hypothetical protein LBL17_04080 [Coxiellaceae bacterium]|nr:hypothetical protein [Coxiellaceae bacterium]